MQLSKSGSKLVDVGSVQEDQRVEISVTGGSSITGFNFESTETAENVKVNLTEFKDRPEPVSNLSGEIYSYYFVEFENLDSYDSAELSYSVPLNWPESVNSSAESVFLKYFDNDWSEIGSASRTETVGSYAFSSGTSVLGYFASGAAHEEQETGNSDIQLRNFQVSTEGDQTVDVDVSIVAENLGQTNGTRIVSFYSDGSLVDERQVSLAPGDSETLNFELTLEEPGSHTLEIASFSRRVEVSEPAGNLIIIGAGAVVLLVIIGLISLIYVRETKRANELEQKIRDFESRGRFGRNSNQQDQNQNPRQGNQKRRDEDR